MVKQHVCVKMVRVDLHIAMTENYVDQNIKKLVKKKMENV